MKAERILAGLAVLACAVAVIILSTEVRAQREELAGIQARLKENAAALNFVGGAMEGVAFKLRDLNVEVAEINKKVSVVGGMVGELPLLTRPRLIDR